MQYRELTIEELPKLVRDVNQAVFWQEYVTFAKRFYDDTVVKLECETYGEYNDEGGTDYSVNSVTALDYNGEEVAIDLGIARPFIIADRQENSWWLSRPDILDVGEDDLEDRFNDEMGSLPIADESEYSFTIDLTQEPTRPRIALIIEN